MTGLESRERWVGHRALDNSPGNGSLNNGSLNSGSLNSGLHDGLHDGLPAPGFPAWARRWLWLVRRNNRLWELGSIGAPPKTLEGRQGKIGQAHRGQTQSAFGLTL